MECHDLVHRICVSLQKVGSNRDRDRDRGAFVCKQDNSPHLLLSNQE